MCVKCSLCKCEFTVNLFTVILTFVKAMLIDIWILWSWWSSARNDVCVYRCDLHDVIGVVLRVTE